MVVSFVAGDDPCSSATVVAVEGAGAEVVASDRAIGGVVTYARVLQECHCD